METNSDSSLFSRCFGAVILVSIAIEQLLIWNNGLFIQLGLKVKGKVPILFTQCKIQFELFNETTIRVI